jgi:hypothetical protein
MRELRREIEIDAPPAAVWAVLTDTRSYSEWNPFIPRLAGELREGAKLEVRIEPPGGRAMTFKPTVLGVEPDRELRWRGRLLLPGIFDGEHILHIKPLDRARSRFTQAERFRGVLVHRPPTRRPPRPLDRVHRRNVLPRQLARAAPGPSSRRTC